MCTSSRGTHNGLLATCCPACDHSRHVGQFLSTKSLLANKLTQLQMHSYRMNGCFLQVCEQLCGWMSQYKNAVRHMNDARFLPPSAACAIYTTACVSSPQAHGWGRVHPSEPNADITEPPVQEVKHSMQTSLLYQAAKQDLDMQWVFVLGGDTSCLQVRDVMHLS